MSCVSGLIVLLGGPLPSGNAVAMRGFTWSTAVFGWCVSSGTDMNAKTQGYPTEHYVVTRWSMLPVSGLNVVAHPGLFTGHFPMFIWSPLFPISHPVSAPGNIDLSFKQVCKWSCNIRNFRLNLSEIKLLPFWCVELTSSWPTTSEAKAGLSVQHYSNTRQFKVLYRDIEMHSNYTLWKHLNCI